MTTAPASIPTTPTTDELTDRESTARLMPRRTEVVRLYYATTYALSDRL